MYKERLNYFNVLSFSRAADTSSFLKYMKPSQGFQFQKILLSVIDVHQRREILYRGVRGHAGPREVSKNWVVRDCIIFRAFWRPLHRKSQSRSYVKTLILEKNFLFEIDFRLIIFQWCAKLKPPANKSTRILRDKCLSRNECASRPAKTASFDLLYVSTAVLMHLRSFHTAGSCSFVRSQSGQKMKMLHLFEFYFQTTQ